MYTSLWMSTKLWSQWRNAIFAFQTCLGLCLESTIVHFLMICLITDLLNHVFFLVFSKMAAGVSLGFLQRQEVVVGTQLSSAAPGVPLGPLHHGTTVQSLVHTFFLVTSVSAPGSKRPESGILVCMCLFVYCMYVCAWVLASVYVCVIYSYHFILNQYLLQPPGAILCAP